MATMAERLLLWLEHDHALECTMEAIKHGGVVAVDIDAIQVMDWDFQLGSAVLEDPDSVSLELLDMIKEMECFDDLDPSSLRLRIRLISAPLPMLPVETLKCKSELDGKLVQIFGVAHAVCKVGKISLFFCAIFFFFTVYIFGRLFSLTCNNAEFMRRLRCRECGRNYDIYQTKGRSSTLPCCCLYGIFEEILEAASFIPYQVIFLGPLPRLCMPDEIHAPLVRVHLHDDLAGKINVGDTVSVIGHLYMDSSIPASATLPKRKNIFGEININANNVLHSFNSRAPDSAISDDSKWPWSQGGTGGGISLDLLIKNFFGSRSGGLLRLASKHCSMSILMSLVSIGGGGSNTPEYSNLPEAKFSRRQVHLLFMAPTSLSAAGAFLEASSAYSPRTIYYHPGAKKQLLATLTASSEPVLQAGSLALSNGGICIVELSKELLSRDELTVLQGAMDNGVISLKNCPELVVPCHSTIWGLHPPSVHGSGLVSNYKSGNKDLLHRQLLSKFDIVVPLYHDQQYGDDEIKEFVLDFNNGRLDIDHHESLKQHISRSSQITSITVTEEAQDFISKYYLLLRRMPESEDVSLSTLECLLRVACASARVCLRNQVLEVPDATLSIFLFEQTQQLKNGCSLLRHIVDRLAVPSTREGDDSFDDFLKDLHQDLKRCMHDPLDRQEE